MPLNGNRRIECRSTDRIATCGEVSDDIVQEGTPLYGASIMTALVCAVEDALRVGFGSLIEAARNIAPDDLAVSGLVPAPAVAELADDAEPEPA